jgi:hypothetical protein
VADARVAALEKLLRAGGRRFARARVEVNSAETHGNNLPPGAGKSRGQSSQSKIVYRCQIYIYLFFNELQIFDEIIRRGCGKNDGRLCALYDLEGR